MELFAVDRKRYQLRLPSRSQDSTVDGDAQRLALANLIILVPRRQPGVSGRRGGLLPGQQRQLPVRLAKIGDPRPGGGEMACFPGSLPYTAEVPRVAVNAGMPYLDVPVSLLVTD